MQPKQKEFSKIGPVTRIVNTAALLYWRCHVCLCDCIEASLKGQRSQITAFYISNKIHTLAFQKVQWNPESQIRSKERERKEVRSMPVFSGGASQEKYACVFWRSVSEGFF